MKTLFLVAVLALSFSALANESLALSECTKGNDEGRSSAKIADSQDGSTSISNSTSSN